VGIFPWTALLVPLVADARKAQAAGRWRDSPAFFFACWAVFPILFFSVPQSKLPGYILPSMPPLMLLIAVSMARRLNDSARSARWWIVAAGASIAVPYAAASIWLSDVPAGTGLAQPRALAEAVALLTAGGVACAVLALRRRERLGLALAALTTAAMIAVVNLRVIPAVDAYVSARAAALATPAEAREAPDMVAFQLDDPWEYGLEFYLAREVPRWTPDGDRPTWVWTNADGAGVLERAGLHYEVANHTLRQAWLLRAAEPPAGASSDVRPTQGPIEGADRATDENSLGPAGAAEKN
jgi:4-amino-4-deoxy-L-arabinose transferase-like glycosyltransferase